MAQSPFNLASLNMETVFASLSSAVLLLDSKQEILYANQAFERLALLSPDSTPGHFLTDYLTDASLVSTASTSRLPSCTICNLGQCNQIPIANGSEISDPLGHIALLRTALDSQIQVKVKHSFLPASPDDSSSTAIILCLIEPFSEEAALTQAHEDFISTISHEFRTPLTSIKGFADTLLQYGSQLGDEEKRRFITIMKDQAERLIRLVENLLTVSQLGSRVSTDLNYRPVAIVPLLDRIAQSLQAKLSAKGGVSRQFSLQTHPANLSAWADMDCLEQILLNLVDNAVKYSPPLLPIIIQAGLLPEDEAQLQISVQDSGAGIPEELLPRIFTKFYRAETPLTQDVEGTGLGLYIAQSLTQAMGGQIFATSTVGKGSCFTVILPAATAERQAIYQKRRPADNE